MTRVEFMTELESLLLDIPLEEREEALQYYSGYFEDAGEDHEEEIIAELGSPKRVAALIKADLSSNEVDRESRGYFTEKGYQDTIYNDNKYEIVKPASKKAEGGSTNDNNQQQQNSNYYNQTGSNSSQAGSNQYQQHKKSNVALIVILCIFAAPLVLPIAASIFGVAIGLIVAVFSIFVSFGIAGFAMIGCGVALFIAGLIKMGIPLVGVALCGSGLIVFGIGMLFVIFAIFLFKTVVPAMIRGFVNLCRLPFKNRSVMA